MKPSVGTPIDRIDAVKKVTGRATYAADTEVTKVAHAVIATSPIGKGTIAALDIDAVRKQPGVLAVITHANAPHVTLKKQGNGPNERVLQLLQDAEVHYNDQPIAVVVADTLERAQHAASMLAPRFKTAGVLATLEQGLGSAHKPNGMVHGEPDSSRGSFDVGIAAAKHVVDATYTTPNENHNPMEPHATIAVWNGGDHVTLYDSTQGIFGVRQRIAEIFAIPKANVRVIDQFVGGGFGCKGTPWSHVALCALAAKVVNRPVKLAVTRPQMFSLVGHRPHTVQHVRLGADPTGKLLATEHAVTSETSMFDEFVEPSALQTRMLYACPNLITSHRLVGVDAPTPTFMRAPGESSGTFAIESAMDELAYLVGIDPIELRLRNYADKDEQENKPFSSKSLRQCYEQAAAKFGWSKRSPKPRSMRDGHELVGYGMATATYPANQWPASARATWRPDGTYLVQSGTQDLGTGTYTVMTQIAADELGVTTDKVTFELGDTAFPEAPVSGGSTTASSVGPAVKAACALLKLKVAAMTPADKAAGQPVTAEAASEVSPQRKQFSLHSFGADFVEVRVDEQLGQIRIARVVAAFATGKILNPKTANNQFVGGIVWGIGMALQEHTVRDRRTGRVVTRDLADYHVPVNADIPAIDVISIDEVDPHVNALGTKGIGEIGITGVTAAIANAVYHATGTRVRDLPITLDKVLV
ncbi:MAG TPA: xanthine dehydrogenase family protein molybdopterin-binding subunit [Kofleriaceae bacterium]|nr:xanthine dehydrogenase family protein molybdopterin-binding subunit [Kofleriaceae bacterium]